MCHMRKKATLRELHLNTSEIIKRVANGETFVIERRGAPVAELRPFARRTHASMPDREEFIGTLPRVKLDSGRILEEDRT
jgi:antitoxin (DNA-binding transcriptional repressor) of toxin-antitoxin stability system